MHQGISESEFCFDLVYKCRKINRKSNMTVIVLKVINHITMVDCDTPWRVFIFVLSFGKLKSTTYLLDDSKSIFFYILYSVA